MNLKDNAHIIGNIRRNIAAMKQHLLQIYIPDELATRAVSEKEQLIIDMRFLEEEVNYLWKSLDDANLLTVFRPE